MTDLVIGGRRHNPQRTFRAVVIAVALLVACFVVAYFIYQRAVSYEHPGGRLPAARIVAEVAPDGGEVQLRYGASTLGHAGNLTVLRLAGAPAAIGAAHGRLLGSLVDDVARAEMPSIDGTVPDSRWLGELSHDVRLRWQHRFLDDGIPGHQLVEIAAVLRGAKASGARIPDYEDFVRTQALFDVGVPSHWSAERNTRNLARSLSFVAPLRGPSGDRLVVGRSLSVPGLSDGGDTMARAVTVSFVHADGVLPYVSVGWPGLVGVVSGMNAEGIAVMVHPARTRDPRGALSAQAAALLARDVLENARTLDEAISVLEHNTPLGAAAFIIVDGNARQWAVVERSPTRSAVARNPASPVVTNILTSEPFADDPENDWVRRVMPSVMRGKRAEKLLRAPLDDAAAAVAVLRDTKGLSDASLPAGHRGAIDDPGATHVALFDVSAMVLWVADGAGARGRFRAFDLRYELRGEGARPAPPPDLAAADAVETERAQAVLAARAELRAARQALGEGSVERAAERAARALAYAPTLPEALLLSGDIARARGDQGEAGRYYRQYLDGGADDLGAEQEIRAMLGER